MKVIKDVVNGVKVTYIKTNKFKSISGSLMFKTNLTEEKITRRMLLLDVLLHSCKKYNTNEKLNMNTLENYNANYNGSTSRYGNCIINSFNFSCVNDKFLNDNILDNVIDTYLEILLRPNIKNKAFIKSEFDLCYKPFEISLKSKKERIRSYGFEKLLDNMDKNAAYSIRPTLKELKKINEKNLYEDYLNFINESEVELYLAGDIDYLKVANKILKDIKSLPCNINKFNENVINKNEIQEFKETINTSGSIVYLGLKLVGLSNYERSYVASIYNAILGVGGSSRCFNIIREKNSLAYYSYSKYDKDDKLITLVAGIDKVNYEKTKKLMQEVLDSMNEITDDELERVKTEIISSLKESEDSMASMCSYYYFKDFYEEKDTKELIKIINKVSKEDIINLNKKIVKDTIFLLEGDK